VAVAQAHATTLAVALERSTVTPTSTRAPRSIRVDGVGDAEARAVDAPLVEGDIPPTTSPTMPGSSARTSSA
jgi:hypothetical protein